MQGYLNLPIRCVSFHEVELDCCTVCLTALGLCHHMRTNKVPLLSGRVTVLCNCISFTHSKLFFCRTLSFNQKTQCPFTFIFTYITQHIIYSLSFSFSLLLISFSVLNIFLPNANYYLLIFFSSTQINVHIVATDGKTSQQPFKKDFFTLDIYLIVSSHFFPSVIFVLTFQHNVF